MAVKNTSDFVDIKALFRQYLSKWYLFVISLAVCGALAFVYVKVKLPVYGVRANLMIKTDSGSPAGALAGEIGAFGDLFGADGYVEDEIFVISSHSLYRNVAKMLRINILHDVERNILSSELAYPDYPVDVIPQEGIIDTLSVSIRFKVSVNALGKADISAKYKKSRVLDVENVSLPYIATTPLGKFTIVTTDTYPQGEAVETSIAVMGYDAAAELIAEDVHSEIGSKRSNLIALSINTPNPKYGKDVLNAIITLYNQRGVQEKNNQGELTSTFLSERIALIADELNDIEREMEKYNKDRGITNLQADMTYNYEKKGKLDEQLLSMQTSIDVLDFTLDFLKNPANAYELLPTLPVSQALQDFITTYNDLIMSRTDLLRSAREGSNAVKTLEGKIDMLRENILESVKSHKQQNLLRLAELQKEYNTAMGSLDNVPAHEREWRTLYRQQTLKAQLYIFLLQRQEENAMMMANATPKGQLVDDAYVLSEPLGMKKKMILLIAIFFGMLIPPVILYLRKLMHNRFETRQDVERMTDVPILGEMCIDNSGHQLVVSAEDTSATVELFRLMRSNLLFVLNDPRDKVVLLTSTSSGEGKSFISINLAASLALLKKRVLLVGMDIRNPQLANYLDINPRFGLTQYLSSSTIELNQIINPMPGFDNMDVICAGPVPPNPAELLISNKVDELFTRLRGMYDYVIVDTAPIGLVSDTFTLDRIADASIYVCRANYTSLADLNLINDIFEQHRLKKVSLVINGTAAKKSYGYASKKQNH